MNRMPHTDSSQLDRQPSRRDVALAALTLPLLCCVGCATAHRPQANPIDLLVVSAGREEPVFEPESGWPLTLSLVANEEMLMGIGSALHPGFPGNGNSGFLTFADPDGCPSWVSQLDQEDQVDRVVRRDGSRPLLYPECVSPPDPPWPHDETWVEFTPGVAGIPLSECGKRPEILIFDHETGANTFRNSVGPCVGSEDDGYGYGANPRLPGLVVVADTGPGVITDENLDRPVPMAVRNLAAFFQSVAYELKSSRGRTRILAHLQVPRGLFSPVVVADFSTPGRCGETEGLLRVDGGEEVCFGEVPLFEEIVSVTAFVVNGKAPDMFQDLDRNGRFDRKDARRAGLEVISNQVVFRFRQFHTDPDLNIRPIELDGDGSAGIPPVGPGGPGGVTDPPR